MKAVRAGCAYFLVVFAAGFALGMIRVPILVPRLGERAAELIEAPFMLAAIWISSRWVQRRFLRDSDRIAPVVTGLLALVLLLGVEFTVVLRVRGSTFREYVDARDPVAGAVWVALLLSFASMPAVQRIVANRRSS